GEGWGEWRRRPRHKRDRMEVPGQADLELLLAAHGLRATAAKRQYFDHGIFLRPLLRGHQRRRDRLGIRQSIFWQALFWRPANIAKLPGLPGAPLQRRGDRHRAALGLKA